MSNRVLYNITLQIGEPLYVIFEKFFVRHEYLSGCRSKCWCTWIDGTTFPGAVYKSLRALRLRECVVMMKLSN